MCHMLSSRKGINLHLQEIKMDLSRGNEKAIGIFVSGSETKQFGWIPKEIISEVERTVQDLPPFSLIRDFGKQNTRENVSKISVSLTCY